MKKTKLLYNPMSGNRSFIKELDSIIKKLQKEGYVVELYRSMAPEDIQTGIENIKKNEYDNIIVAGGDGSLSQVINAMKKREINIPLAVLPAGTANDIASHLKMPSKFVDCIDILKNKKLDNLDLAKIDNNYFINVFFLGEFSNIPEETPEEFKTFFGKLAYYINGIKELPRLKPIPLRIQSETRLIEEELLFLIIINSKQAGGFKKLCPPAELNDGLLDFIGIKYRGLHKLPALFMQILQGEHLTNPDIIYFQDKYFEIEYLDSVKKNYYSDIDGERGPQLPLTINVEHHAIKMYTNFK
ncbi:MAG: YegS/Rv2252/BmrU family lipid kinase [Halanaerobiales bacterium]